MATKLLFMDTETTGTEPSLHGLTQVAGIIDEVEIRGGILVPKEIERFDLKCQPFRGKKISDKALEVNGLTRADLESRPEPIGVYQELLALFDKHVDRYKRADKFILVGQNPKFDYDFVSQWFKDCRNEYFYAYVDYHLQDIGVFTNAFRLLGKLDVPNTKLETIAKHFNLPLKAHDAMSDISVTRTIFYSYMAILATIKGKIA